MASDILKGLPSYNKENFSKFKADENLKTTNARAIPYIHTDECEPEEPQVIVTDKTNILLRYLRKQLDSKKSQSKRNTLPSSSELAPSAKVPRLDTGEDEEND